MPDANCISRRHNRPRRAIHLITQEVIYVNTAPYGDSMHSASVDYSLRRASLPKKNMKGELKKKSMSSNALNVIIHGKVNKKRE
jgi:hypothetical protein